MMVACMIFFDLCSTLSKLHTSSAIVEFVMIKLQHYCNFFYSIWGFLLSIVFHKGREEEEEIRNFLLCLKYEDRSSYIFPLQFVHVGTIDFPTSTWYNHPNQNWLNFCVQRGLFNFFLITFKQQLLCFTHGYKIY